MIIITELNILSSGSPIHCKKCLLNCGTIVVFHSIILAIMTVQIII